MAHLHIITACGDELQDLALFRHAGGVIGGQRDRGRLPLSVEGQIIDHLQTTVAIHGIGQAIVEGHSARRAGGLVGSQKGIRLGWIADVIQTNIAGVVGVEIEADGADAQPGPVVHQV